MTKIIPLIVLMLLSVFFTKAQNLSQAEKNTALQLVSQLSSSNDAAGISADLISNSKVFYTYEDVATGIRYVSLQQVYKDIPVYNQILALSFRGGKLLSNFGAFDPNIENRVNVASGTPAVTAESAVQSALSDRGFHATQMAIALNRKDEGRFVEFSNMGVSREKITAQLTWVPDELTKTYNLAWQVYIIPKTTSDYWMVRVNAVNNSILGVDNYTDYDNWGVPNENPNIKYPGFDYGKGLSVYSNPETRNFFDFKKIEVKKTDDPSLVTTASYRVVPIPAESPLHPGGAPALRTDPWLNAGVVANAVTLKWHTGAAAADYDHSRSNNIWAYEDRTAPANTGTIAKSAASQTAFPNLTFDFVPDFTQEPTVNTVAVPNQRFNITNLFYWNNIAHDVLYGYGFTEAGKNFQDDNLGRGGVGNDHVNAEAQDASGTNNANFSTPADGGSGRMQMFLWTAPTPDRDGDVDNGIILHELGHGVSNRSNPGGTGCLGNAEQAGEGWSDYIGLMLTQDWATATNSTGFNSPRGIGTYALNQPNNGPGIRPQRYCTDFAVNNATYSTLPGQAIPHGVGWVFCSALWELTWELINTGSNPGIEPNIYNFASTKGNVVAMRLMMEGLRTQQCQPGFISARNAILRADTTLYGAANACAIWRAFARRGMGFGAAEGSTFSITDQTVSFTMPPACGVVVGPSVTINQAAAQPDPTSASPINFTIVFSEAVVGFANGDVTLGGTAGATTQNITGGPTTWNVAVSGMTATGTVTASIAAGVCTNAALEANNASTSTDNLVNYIATPAGTCTTFVASIVSTDPTMASRPFRDGVVKTCAAPGGPCNAASVAGTFNRQVFQWTNPVNQCVTVTYIATNANFTFLTVYNAPPTFGSLCTNWVTDAGSSGTNGVPIVFSFNAIAGTTYYFLVNNITTLPANCTIQISAATCAAVAPGVTINQAAAQPDPTGASPINFTAVFSEAVTGFANGDVTLSGTAGATTQNITGGPTTYNIAISGMTGTGTVIPTIAAGVCVNASSVPNTASTSTDNTVTYNAPAGCTSVNPVANQTVCNGSPTAAVNFSSPTPGTTFSWVNNNTSIGLGASGSGNIPSFTATNGTTAPVVATVTVTPTLTLVTPTTTTFNFTGGAQTFTVPAGVTSINFTALGAEGGTGATGGNGATGGAGGRGSRATGTLAVAAGQIINIFVGGAGGSPAAGFNGGAAGGSTNAGGGGGASDVRFPGAATADRILTAGGGGGGGRAGCETAGVAGGTGGNGDGNGVNGTDAPTPGGFAGGGFGAIGTAFGGAGIGCGGFLGAPGLAGTGAVGGNGGAGQTCCCFTFGSVPGGGGGGGGQLGGGGGGGGSAGTVGCSGNDKGAGGGGAGGTSYTGGVTAGVVTTNIQTGNGQVVLNYNVTTTCTGPTMAFTITVNPTPAVNAIPNQVVCQNAPTAPVNFTGTPAGVVFQWTNNNTTIGLAAAGTGNIPSFIALNPTNVQQVATITVTPVTGLSTPVTTTFAFTGAVQTYTVPAGITSLNIKTWGAQGNSNALAAAVGGLGGYAEGNLVVTPGQVLNVMVGGGAATSITGGFNGGGNAGVNTGCATAQGGGGGGASDVRIAPYALGNRVIVGAGGGGAGANRVAGCGRGTGGGGGGGYFGGGGGAGWPGIPGSQGPVPTGGTQAAGGAGGVTTFSPGPTNGFPGVSGVGGAGGTEIGSAQGGSATAEPGGIGGGLTGGSGLYNQVNNWCGQSGAGGSSYIGGVSGGLTTPGLRSGNGQVQITYTPASATTCFGTARSFTITVNPNANLIIVADPGTTICEGDPTLLTVYDAGAVTGPGTLYTQGTGVPANGSPSQVFEPVNTAFNSQGADDFTIPAAGNWSITQITANGIGNGAPTSVNVFFYTNSANLPGTAIASFNNITTFTRVGGNYTVTLPSALNLGAGTYWMSFQVNMAFAGNGQWFWGNFGTTNIGNQYAWQNPGGGFATPCTSWGYGATGCGVGGPLRNNIFSIIGTSVGLGPQSTGTFLWSPAAGLSSTTSNPVAASPMNTTTYTVTRTTVPGGCQASANITITVNKRPTVTTQPTSAVNCSGTTATFTAAATGTGLTYQWQVSTAGCAGPWTNLTNLPPYSGVNGPVLTISPVNGTMNGYGYRLVVSGTCAAINNANISNCVTLTVNPLPNLVVTPPVSCGGVAGISGTALTVTQLPTPVPGSVAVNSGTISVPIPDATNVAATSNLTVGGIPANATITEVRVNMNINHTWVGDVDVNLRAPNNTILNLVAGLNGGTGGNAGNDFINTAFSSLGGTTISGAPDPRTGTFAAEARAGRGPIGFIQTVTTWGALYPAPTDVNGVWTLAMGDRVGTDFGTLTNWSITVNYSTPGSGPLPTLSYVWSPVTGLFTLPNGTGAYTGQNLATVYAAPTTQTIYTVTATNVATGCVGTATALVNYTPPAPTVTPNPVVMCLGDPAVKLKSSSSTSASLQICSGPISVVIPDATASGSTSNLTVSGVPAGCNISNMSVTFNINHTWDGDIAIALRAPNGQILNLDYYLSNTGGTGATTGFVNTKISSTGTAALSSGTNPYTGTFRADASTAAAPPSGPTGFAPTTTTWAPLYSTPNGIWTLAMVDAFGGDQGTLTSWCIDLTYVCGVVASPAVWTPAAGLFSDAAALIPYVAGTGVDSVWTRPTPAGVYTYQVTVNNVINFSAVPATPMAGGNGNNLVSFNVRNNNAFPVTFAGISSNAFGSGAVTARVFYKPGGNAGAPGPISAANGWTQFGTANVNVTANTLNPVLTGLTLPVPAGATYAIALDFTGATFPAYTNGAATTVTYTSNGCDIITGGNVGWGGPAAPGTPVNNPRNFNGTVTFLVSGPGTCQSPARTVTVTVNQPTTVTLQPVNQTICTDKVATFTVAAGGSGPFTYQWQVSTNNGNPPWTNITNGGVYSGATTATLTITAPPVSMSGYQYRVIINGAAPCAAATSLNAILTVNPLPVVTIAPVYSALMPGMTATLTSTVTPNAPAPTGGYTWIRDGVVLTSSSAGVLSGIGTGTLRVDVDGMGLYSLRVTDVNGCTSTSNSALVKDSASGKCFIYPNPNSGQFQVRYYSVANNILPRGIVVYDAKGDRVKVQNYTIGRPYDRMDVDLRAQGKGLYWVEVVDRNGNRLTMCRVVIQ